MKDTIKKFYKENERDLKLVGITILGCAVGAFIASYYSHYSSNRGWRINKCDVQLYSDDTMYADIYFANGNIQTLTDKP